MRGREDAMKEQLYEIPVNDAFDTDCECPVCQMYHTLEADAIDYTMGSSYMQEDVRAVSDKVGFCPEHIRLMYANGNRLGLALMLDTHYQRFIREMKGRAKKSSPSGKSGMFGKKSGGDIPVTAYVHELEKTCFVCDHINQAYPRYIHTIYYLWKNDPDFREKFRTGKGFCLTHYAELYDGAGSELSKDDLDGFIEALNEVFFTNIERVHEDISWFIEKYDYRNKDAPWKNAKDALPRGVLKLDHVFVGDE